MKLKILSIILATTVLSACSSIVSKSEYAVAISSSPEGADFIVTNRTGQQVHNGTTPASVILKASAGYFKRETYTITINKEGYSPKTIKLSSSVDGWYWGNILIGGLIGMLIVDPATGAMYSLPDRIDVAMTADETSNVTQKDITIATIDSLTQEQVSRLVPVK